MTDLTVQFLAFEGCPLADAARGNLQKALEACGVSGFEEIDILAPEAPDALRGWGSPTILIDGRDITGRPKGESVSCRVYPGPERVPDEVSIVAAITRAQKTLAKAG